MAFDINIFNQSISEFGIAQNSKFDVTVALPSIITSNTSAYPYASTWATLTPLRAMNCTTPGAVLMSHETYNLGVGKKIEQPYNAAFTPVRISFILDSQGIIEETFNLWMNYRYQFGFDQQNLPTFMANYRSQTVSPLIQINKYDRFGNTINQYNIVGAAPTIVQNQQLDWSDVNTISVLNITFNYSGYSIT